MFKTTFKNILVLALICLVSSLSLAYINSITSPIIQKINNDNLQRSLLEVSNNKKIVSKVDVNQKYVNYYYNLEDDGYLVSLNANGYGGPMVILASYDDKANLVKAKLLSDSETPGLGKKANDKGYMNKYYTNPIPTTKSQLSSTDSVSVSGASITFSAIGNALKIGQDFVKELQSE